MSDMVSVPAEKIAALREILTHQRQYAAPRFIYAAARDVVDAVETEAAPDELTALRERIRALADEWASRADEAYDYGMQLRTALGGRMTGIPDAESVTPHICNAAHPDDCTKPGHPMSAGDRDTLTDALKTAFDQWDEYGAQHGYSAVDDTFWVDGYSFADLESIVAARVRAAQTQAWDEGWADGQTPFKYPRESNPYSDATDEFQNPED